MTQTIAYPFDTGHGLTRVIQAGSEGPPVVFVHGLGARADRWRGTVGRLGAQGYRCFALDLPGHGFAVKGDAYPYGVPAFADCVEGLIDRLGLGRVTLVGTSLGGHVCAMVATRRPDSIRGLMLVGAVGIVPLGADAGAAIQKNVQMTGREAIEAKMRFVLADATLITHEFVEEEWRINNSPGAAEAFQRLGRYIAHEIDRDNVADALRPLTARIPTRLVWGAADRAVTPAIGAAAAERLGVAAPDLIEAAGHAPYMERPEAFDPILAAFLAGLPG